MAGLLMEFGLIVLFRNFQQRRLFRYLKTSTQVQQGAVLCSRCDYILGTGRHRFELVWIRDIHNYTPEHFAIWERLLIFQTQCHARYLWGRREFLLKLPPPAAELSGVDVKFHTINNLEPSPPNLKRPPHPLWVYPKSIWMIDTRAALRCNPRHNRNVERGLTTAVWRSLLVDSWRQAE